VSLFFEKQQNNGNRLVFPRHKNDYNYNYNLLVLLATFINLTIINCDNIIHNSDRISDLFLLFALFIY